MRKRSEIYRMLFDKNLWSEEGAENWLNENGYDIYRQRETKNNYRFVTSPKKIKPEQRARYITFGKGIKTLIVFSGPRKNPYRKERGTRKNLSVKDEDKQKIKEQDFAYELGYKYGEKASTRLEKIYDYFYFRDRNPTLNAFIDSFWDLAHLEWKKISSVTKEAERIADMLNDACYYVSYREMWDHFYQGFDMPLQRLLDEIIDTFLPGTDS